MNQIEPAKEKTRDKTVSSSQYVHVHLMYSMKKNDKVSHYGPAHSDFGNAIIFLKHGLRAQNPNFRVIETVGGIHFTDMSPENYDFIIYNKEVIEKKLRHHPIQTKPRRLL
jgi:hypothetical protein